MHSLWRTTVALALGPWLVLSAAGAPEHVHEADAHHSYAVAHRHFSQHHHEGGAIAHDEERLIWLDALGVQQPTYQLPVAHAIVPEYFDARPAPRSWIVAFTLGAALPHGPPRSATSPRAPPLPSC